MCFFFVFQIFVCVRVCIIINFINPRQMPVNTRRQTAGLSPLIKVSKKIVYICLYMFSSTKKISKKMTGL